MTSQGLSLTGKLFFGGLTAGTFGLGTWQTQRYFDKVEKVKERERDLSQEPIPYGFSETTNEASSFRKCLIRGQFRHAQELLIGPRGPPPGALAADGPTSGRSGGGMSSGPQGYYVVTPFELQDENKTILMNRGWIPRHFPEHDVEYDHPQGMVEVVAVSSQGENPRFMMPPHNFSKRPPRLYWMDLETMHDVTGDGKEIFVEVDSASDNDQKEERRSYPAKPPPSTVGEFKVSPLTHAGYALTWYGLAAAGMVMTRKLITRGRM